jgi:hypothetical protein
MQQCLKLLPQRFFLPAGSAAYGESLGFWPRLYELFPKGGGTEGDRLRAHCDALLLCEHGGFDAGLRCLHVRLGRAAARQRDTALMEALRRWVARFGRAGGALPTWKVGRIRGWFDFVVGFDQKLFPLVALELTKGVRPFWVVWTNMARLAARSAGAVTDGIRAAAVCLEVRCQREAVLALGTRCDCQKVARLAAFEADCAESDALSREIVIFPC